MAKTLEFFFDYVSPTAYLAWHATPDVLERTGAEIVYRPMFLGGVMQATGNRPPGMVAAKGEYMNHDMARCARRIGVEMFMNPAFPMNTLRALRATVGLAGEPETQERFMAACFNASWGAPEPKNLGERSAVEEICADLDLDAERILAMGSDDGLKDALMANTNEAVERGAFGAPTFFVGDEMFFGHDRLDYVEEALAA